MKTMSKQAIRSKAAAFKRQAIKATHHKQRGFGAIEFGLVLLLIGALIAAAVLFYRDSQRKQSVNNNTSDIIFVSGNLVSKYGQLNRYGDVTTELAVKSGVIPGHLRVPGTDDAQNRFGGVIELNPTSLNGTNDAMEITWPNVTPNQCSDIVSATEAEFRVITVDGTEVKSDGDQVDISGLEDACDASLPVEIVFTVGRS